MIELTNICNETSFEPFLAEILIADLLYGKGLHHMKDVPQVKQILLYENKLRKLFNRSKVFKIGLTLKYNKLIAYYY